MSLYADPPAKPPALEDCGFYHTMEIPGVGVVEGEWDLRGREATYLGDVPFAGRRVLEVGPASGALTFWMEAQGAEVVAVDLHEDAPWDRVPYARDEPAPLRAQERERLQAIRNGFWLAHAASASRARLVTATAYDIPAAIGSVDVAVVGSLLLHLRDPFSALESALRLARETAVVVEPIWRRHYPALALGRLTGRRSRAPLFLPRFSRRQPKHGWWYLPPTLLQEMLGVLGFERSRVRYHRESLEGRPRLNATIVATRTAGAPAPPAGRASAG